MVQRRFADIGSWGIAEMTQKDLDATVRVLDAGGRYGMHPTWKGFSGDLNYIMFEPDREEASRLAESYAKTRPDVHVEQLALGRSLGTLTMHTFRHKGQSSHYLPNMDNLWFKVARPDEAEIVDTYEAQVTTADAYAQDNALDFDFFKIDTEGHELPILEGALTQLAQSVLGVRAEVYFDTVLHNIPLFSELHDFMMARGFQLLNLSYTGQGQHLNAFADGPRYGMLLDSDAVWVLRPETLAERGVLACLKYAAFCFANDAADVAVAVLKAGVTEWGFDYVPFSGTALFKGLDVTLQRLCKKLQDRPGQDPKALEEMYAIIFSRELKGMHEFYQSEEVNPLV